MLKIKEISKRKHSNDRKLHYQNHYVLGKMLISYENTIYILSDGGRRIEKRYSCGSRPLSATMFKFGSDGNIAVALLLTMEHLRIHIINGDRLDVRIGFRANKLLSCSFGLIIVPANSANIPNQVFDFEHANIYLLSNPISPIRPIHFEKNLGTAGDDQATVAEIILAVFGTLICSYSNHTKRLLIYEIRKLPTVTKSPFSLCSSNSELMYYENSVNSKYVSYSNHHTLLHSKGLFNIQDHRKNRVSKIGVSFLSGRRSNKRPSSSSSPIPLNRPNQARVRSDAHHDANRSGMIHTSSNSLSHSNSNIQERAAAPTGHNAASIPFTPSREHLLASLLGVSDSRGNASRTVLRAERRASSSRGDGGGDWEGGERSSSPNASLGSYMQSDQLPLHQRVAQKSLRISLESDSCLHLIASSAVAAGETEGFSDGEQVEAFFSRRFPVRFQTPTRTNTVSHQSSSHP